MTKEDRQSRWDRRKSKGSQRTQKQGFISGNPRYSPKSSGHEGSPRKGHRND